MLAAAEEALAGLEPWTWEAIERALRDALLVDGLGLKPRAAFSGAVRVAITGRRIGPPLFESIELLGRDRTLGRLARARAIAAGGDPAGGGSEPPEPRLNAPGGDRPGRCHPLWPPGRVRLDFTGAGGPAGRSDGVWGNWQPDGFWPR